MTFRIPAALALIFGCWSFEAMAQAPAAPPPVPADVSPLYVVTYFEAQPAKRDEAARLVIAYRDAMRGSSGHLRSIAVQRPRRLGQFVVVSAWQNKAAWDGAAEGTKEAREKLSAIRNAPTD